MSELKGKKLIFISFLLSILYPILLIQESGFPYLGLGIFYSTIATLIYRYKPEKNKSDTFLYASVLFFSIFIFIRANEFVTLLNFFTLVYLVALLLLNNGIKTSFIRVILAPINAFLNIISSNSAFNYRLNKVKKSNDFLGEHFAAIILTVFILLITVPLLAYSNPFFNDIVNSIIRGLNISDFLKDFYIHIIRFILFSILLFLFPRLIFVATVKKTVNVDIKIINTNLMIPKIAMSLILIIFFITQAQLYFSSTETLNNLGYTNSQYAREVFAQLGIVAGIILLLIYNDTGKYRFKSFLTYFLMTETFFLSAIAFKSVLDYTNAWGFTHKRLYGYTGVFWLIGALYLAYYQYKHKFTNSFFITRIIILTVAVLLTINFSNYDYLIYHFRKTTLPTGTDYHYLSSLSADSISYPEQLELYMESIKDKPTLTFQETLPANRILNNIKYLQQKYSKMPAVGAINLAELAEFNRVKDINVTRFSELLSAKIVQPQPTISP